MKIFKHLKIFFILAIVFSFVAFFIKQSLTDDPQVNAGSSQNTSGFAWSQNVGWFSFNSKNCDTDDDGQSEGGAGCPPAGTNMASYGVNIDPITGILSGFAWSENIGWISFYLGK